MRDDPLLTDERLPAGRRPDDGTGTAPYGRRRALAALGLGAVAVLVVVALLNVLGRDDPAPDSADGVTATTVTGATATPATTTPPTVPSVDGVGSLWWLVNRDRPLPDGYVPSDLVVPNVPLDADAAAIQLTAATAAAFEAMAADAAAAGY